MKKYILHICLTESWGGLEMAVSKWSAVLKENGHKNLIICTPGSPLSEDLKSKGFKILEWDSAHYFAPDFTIKLRKLLKTEPIDAVVLQNLRDLWIVSPAFWGLKNVALIGFAQMLIGIKKKDLLHKIVYKPLKYVMTLTDWQQGALSPYLPVPTNKFRTIPNFVDTELFHPRLRNDDARYQMGFKKEDFVIGIIGRIDQQKGQKELLEAFAKLAPLYENTQLLIIGEPTRNEESQERYFRDLHAFVKKHKLGKRVHFKGFQKETHKIYANLDLFVLASYKETFGFVVIEAMASGTSVLGTKAGGVPEILGQGDFGYLCEPKSSQSIFESIQSILEDKEARTSKKEKAIERVRAFYDRNQVYKRFIKYI